ncbi:ADP-glyceromanno-heptose 6-epimerase [Synechococcus sp. CBW1002]|uniref:ADP-glyceromanno-heptose 6-epimerase n=1 Tax=Synechococcus sp. CBW1002 TaxID=1353134 RepID=UPI0018CCCCD7|nr:ADP-glyceromanno-heptose 6-epimerase [Synechococcus sp. CBW1002]QPN59143.1 ADP-glyceromanno-heptose 6-epimerase [Synechococcus sp. CBW1002]
MIIITGAAGFIGSNMVAELSEAGGSYLVACDYWSCGNKWMNVAKHFVADFISPVQLFPFIRESASRIRAIVHMGAISATTERNVDRLIADNIRLTIDLWDLCADYQIPFIYASSAATYGALETGLIDDQDPVALAQLRPLNAYGWSKHATDRILMQRVADGMPAPPQWCGLKFFNVYGPNEYHKGDMQSVVAKFFADVRDCKPIRLFQSHRPGMADGAQSRDFVYVKDCTMFMKWLLENPAVSGLFNVGTGEARSFRDLLTSIATALQVPISFDFAPMPEHLRDRYQYFTQAEVIKLRSTGYMVPFHSIESGVADYVVNYLNTDDLYR